MTTIHANSMEFKEFNPGTKVLGGSFLSIIRAMDAFKSLAESFMKEEGLDNVVYDREHWYPLQAWLNVLKKVKEKIGPNTLLQIGKQVTSDKYPSFVTNLEEAFSFMNKAYHRNHADTSGNMYFDFDRPDIAPKDGIGSYTFTKTDENSGIMVCHTPYPESFEKGILIEMTRHFHSRGEVVHLDDRDCKSKEKESCSYLISWK